MKVFLINLDKDIEKLAAADRQLKALGVKYERVPAVYGKDLSDDEKKNTVDYFRWWCAVGRSVADAEIGCALSHYGIYSRMSGAEQCVCILEDDVVLDSVFPEMLEFVEQNVDASRPQVILLSDHEGRYDSCQDNMGGGHRSLIRSENGTCAEAYVITFPAAKALLKKNLPMVVPCDTWGRWAGDGSIELYHALPTVAGQNQEKYGSSTSSGRKSVNEYALVAKMNHYMKRSIGKTMDFVLRKATGK